MYGNIFMTVQGFFIYCLLGFFFSSYWCSIRKSKKWLVFAAWPFYAFFFIFSQITKNL